MKKTKQLLEDLKARGIFKDITSEEKFLAQEQGAGVYIGFDPTAPSLHLGNYIQIMLLKRFEQFGFKPYALIGGATGMIGDPSGRSSERILLDKKVLSQNIQKITKQIKKFNVDVINNADFYAKMNVIEYLRDVGKLINVSQMLSKEAVNSRLEHGISYTEFSYQLLQGWDFKCCYESKGITVQVGGSDQWGNITTGIDIIGKTNTKNNKAVGLTVNLLLDKDGNKYGKSSGGTPIWIEPALTSPNGLYQFLYATPDSEVRKLLCWLTDLPIKKIDEVIAKHEQNRRNRFAQKELAYIVTSQVHSAEMAMTAKDFYDKQIEKFESDLPYRKLLNWDFFIQVLEKYEKELHLASKLTLLSKIKEVYKNAEKANWKYPEKISTAFQLIAEKNNKSAIVFLAWSWFLLKTKSYEKAIAKAEKSAKFDRDNPITFFIWGTALEELGQKKLAKKKITTMLQLDKNNILDSVFESFEAKP